MMMEVSTSTNNMEGIEGTQGNGSNNRLSQAGFCKFHSAQTQISSATFLEECIEPSPVECEAYDQYVNLPELSTMWKSREFFDWSTEQFARAALQALEITFKLISSVLCDTRSYIDKEEWKRRLESLVVSQLELVSLICENDKKAPTVQLSASSGLLATKVSQEVWQRPGSAPVVSRTSEESLLPRLGKWKRAEQMVSRICLAIECHMRRTPFTLGLGEPNLAGKPILEYDKVCQPNYLHSLRHYIQFHNPEDRTLSSVHQIFEAWIFIGKGLLERINNKIDELNPERASKDCWLVEKVWKLLGDIQSLLLVMDPDDFLRLKHQLAISSTSTPAGAYCLRSNALREFTNECRALKHLVPKILGVEADPKGGPRLQEAVMHLLHSHGFARRREISESPSTCSYSQGTVHLLLAFQAVEAALKNFFFSYQQLVMAVMGSVEIKASPYLGNSDALSQIYYEPSYFPSVDGAKAFLSDYWQHQTSRNGSMEGIQKKSMRVDRNAWVSSHH